MEGVLPVVQMIVLIVQNAKPLAQQNEALHIVNAAWTNFFLTVRLSEDSHIFQVGLGNPVRLCM